ncbi:hypothetical protein MLD38_014853 [Melastoma candidum]|nr:hypothetical protein MLD38_014853 [Melastoma candidum]
MGDPSSVGKLLAPSVDMRIRITADEVIKPRYSPPSHLRNFELSLLNQYLPPWLYCHIILFYTATTSSVNASEKVSSLKNSLSDTLVLFYPLAGKIKDAMTIECNDPGAVFIEAQIDTRLSRLMSKPDPDLLHRLLPFNDADTMGKFANCALLLQVTIFDCGGLALAVCPTHKLRDASSMCTFLKAWAKLTTLPDNNCTGDTVSPLHFLGPSIILPVKHLPDHPFSPHRLDSEKFSSRRFVFSGSNLKSLKAKSDSIDSSG